MLEVVPSLKFAHGLSGRGAHADLFSAGGLLANVGRTDAQHPVLPVVRASVTSGNRGSAAAAEQDPRVGRPRVIPLGGCGSGTAIIGVQYRSLGVPHAGFRLAEVPVVALPAIRCCGSPFQALPTTRRRRR